MQSFSCWAVLRENMKLKRKAPRCTKCARDPAIWTCDVLRSGNPLPPSVRRERWNAEGRWVSEGKMPTWLIYDRRKCDWAEVSFCLWSRSGRRCPLISRVSGRLYTPHTVNVFHPMKPNNSRLITSLLYHFLCPMVYLMKPVTGGPLGQSVTIFNHCHYRRNYFFITANRCRMKSQHIPAVGEKRDSCNFHLCIISTNGWLSCNFLLGYF